MSLKTEILKIKGDWTEVASDCRATVGKPPLDHEPSVDFKKKNPHCGAQSDSGHLRKVDMARHQKLGGDALEPSQI